MPEEKTPSKQTAQRGFCGSKFHRLPTIDEQDGDLRSVSGRKRRVPIHVHFRQMEAELAPQPLAERSEILTQVAPAPAVEVEAKRLLSHRDGTRTVSRSRRRVNAAPPAIGTGRPVVSS